MALLSGLLSPHEFPLLPPIGSDTETEPPPDGLIGAPGILTVPPIDTDPPSRSEIESPEPTDPTPPTLIPPASVTPPPHLVMAIPRFPLS
jgi:hypothetical protein